MRTSNHYCAILHGFRKGTAILIDNAMLDTIAVGEQWLIGLKKITIKTTMTLFSPWPRRMVWHAQDWATKKT